MIPLKIQAIQTALTGNWNNAVSLNQKLLKDNPNDIETLNRLAFALSVIGKIKEAKNMYKKVLDLDSQNPIALKNLKRLSNTTIRGKQKTELTSALIKDTNTMFLEESGKTKVVELVNIAEPKIITNLMTGELLNLQIKRLKIFVLDGRKRYIGMLPEDIGKRLIRFLKGGNSYQVCVRSVENRRITIFIKEIRRSARFKNQASFVYLDKPKPTTSKSFLNRESEDVSTIISEEE